MHQLESSSYLEKAAISGFFLHFIWHKVNDVFRLAIKKSNENQNDQHDE